MTEMIFHFLSSVATLLQVSVHTYMQGMQAPYEYCVFSFCYYLTNTILHKSTVDNNVGSDRLAGQRPNHKRQPIL